MKSAKAWMIDIYGDYDEGTEDVIRRIQRDALEAAAEYHDRKEKENMESGLSLNDKQLWGSASIALTKENEHNQSAEDIRAMKPKSD